MIHHVVPDIGELASGPAHSVPSLCASLADRDIVMLHVLESASQRTFPFSLRQYARRRIPYRLGLSRPMYQGLLDSVGADDVLHAHGLWMAPNVYPGLVKKRVNCTLVISPRGTMSEWAMSHSRCIKQLVWHAGQKSACRQADCFHATSEEEYKDIRRLGFTSPVTIVPNGITVPAPRHNAKEKTVLYLGRIHPKKGLDWLLEAWSTIEARFSGWRLVIVGRDEAGERQKLQRLAEERALERVTFRPPAYGEAKDALFRTASLFVLPTRSENFGIAVAESLSYGVPVITTKGAPWQGLIDRSCGWWVDMGVAPLVKALDSALLVSDEERMAMGDRGRAWMQASFSWQEIGQKMHQTYQWLRSRERQPACVVTD